MKYNTSLNPDLKPFIKWVGGKRKLLVELENRLPKNINELTYFEPFLGGGALFLYLQPKNAIISDSNTELINCWNIVKNKPNELINDLDKLESNKETYYELRKLDHDPNFKTKDNEVLRAVRFIYLNKLCFNALWRENKNGYMNAPYNGNTAHISTLVNYDNIIEISKYLNSANITIRCCSYEDIIKEQTNFTNTFWYLDPPYADSDFKKTFNSYNANAESNDIFHEKLRNNFTILTNNGAKVLESNNNSQYVKTLYDGYFIDDVYTSRCIGGLGSERGQIKELIIRNYENL